ncbi:MAG: hypothetical protein H6Q65_1068, partial [Firmicutes bacterium]|nr:hypothetical protein [Bacillota bacterium]
TYAESTWLETAWEDRKSPVFASERLRFEDAFLLAIWFTKWRQKIQK